MFRASETYRRLRGHEATGQFVRFAVVGAINFATYFALYNGFLRLHVQAVAAGALAFALSSISSFFLNKFWAFRDRKRTAMGRQYVVFTLFTLIGLGINTGALALFLIPLRRFGTLGKNGAALCAQPFSLAWNFTAYRRWTFRPAPEPVTNEGSV